MSHLLQPQIIDGKYYYVVSSSALGAFKRCRKSFDLGYLRGYEARDVGQPVDDGRRFHEHMKAIVTGEYDVLARAQAGDEMAKVAWAYAQHNEMPEPGSILAVEEPVYVKLIEPFHYPGKLETVPGIILRCTFDLAYRYDETRVVVRDYKTFDRAPTLYVDLDFQGRIYIAAAMRAFNSPKAIFEYAHVRRTPPNEPPRRWKVSECYLLTQLIIDDDEIDRLWNETQEVAYDLVRAIGEERFYRQDLKTGPHACSSCFWRHGCVTEIATGSLTPEEAEIFYTVRTLLTIPEGTKVA